MRPAAGALPGCWAAFMPPGSALPGATLSLSFLLLAKVRVEPVSSASAAAVRSQTFLSVHEAFPASPSPGPGAPLGPPTRSSGAPRGRLRGLRGRARRRPAPAQESRARPWLPSRRNAPWVPEAEPRGGLSGPAPVLGCAVRPRRSGCPQNSGWVAARR